MLYEVITDMVCAVKRSKKRNLQAADGFIFDKASLSLDLLPGPGSSVIAPVDDPDVPVVLPAIGGADIDQVAFERMIQSGNFRNNFV